MRRSLLLTAPATLAALLLVGCTSNSESPATHPGFYAEITVEVDPDPADRIALLDGQTAGQSSIRWWYAEGDDEVGRWRWEIEGSGPSIDAGTRTTVFDGEYQWEYDDRPQTYQRTSRPPPPDGLVQSPIFGSPVGPANFPDVDAFIEGWQQNLPEREIIRTGEETVLGRQTAVFEIRSPGGTASPQQLSDSIRFSLDPERMFIMRWIVDDHVDDRSRTIEISRLDYDTPIDAGRLTFDPPPGATERIHLEDANCSTSLESTGVFGVPAGFLDPADVPTGFRSGGVSAEAGPNGCGIVATQTLAENPDGDFIVLRQRIRPDGIPPALRTDAPVSINGRDAYPSEAGGITRLVWSRDDIVAELVSNAFPVERLVTIAASAQLRPETGRP